MSTQPLTLEIRCPSCDGTGLYVGLAESDGTAVVCSTCTGSGKSTYHYRPFEGRMPAPASVTSVHVGRGYVLSTDHPQCDGGVPVNEYVPGMTVPADEKLYCPYLYTGQEWCARPAVLFEYEGAKPSAPLLPGDRISECRHWVDKAACWATFHAEAPAGVKDQVS